MGKVNFKGAFPQCRQTVIDEPFADLTNGELYDEWNEACWARLRGEKIAPERQARLDAIEAELSMRPAEREAA